MRILLVAMSNSIHTARWVNLLKGQDWDIHVFPSQANKDVRPELKGVTVYYSFYTKQCELDSSVRLRGIPVLSRNIARVSRYLLRTVSPDYRSRHLNKVIKNFRPDIIHSMETQDGGYLTLDAKKKFKGQFPKWIHTIWGSDIYLFSKLKKHKPRIKEVLKSCDTYICECKRDVKLARELGYKGDIIRFPGAGGFDFKNVLNLRQKGPISKRRIIMLKGYQGWSGRALVGLRALERCSELLKGYEIIVYSVYNPEVKIAVELFKDSTGIPIRILPEGTLHKEMLRMHGKARISIGLSISDGLPNSLLEAMVMESFPIQSNTSCGNEWIEDGNTGILVPPNDPEIVESAIRQALTNDLLVNNAAIENKKLVLKKLSYSDLRKKVINIYKQVYKKH